MQGLVIIDTLIYNAVGEHGLVGDTEDKDTEAKILLGLRVLPHICQSY